MTIENKEPFCGIGLGRKKLPELGKSAEHLVDGPNTGRLLTRRYVKRSGGEDHSKGICPIPSTLRLVL